ncbi:MAG: hypothetical protein IJL30_05265 [Clostridia bacterium]|nr:hypothetical protein [Clostridia bacterium]
MMPVQRVCGGEMQTGNKLSNGPLRAQSNEHTLRVFCDVRQTLHAGDMQVSRKRTGHAVNQGGTADIDLFVLDSSIILSRTFLLSKNSLKNKSSFGKEDLNRNSSVKSVKTVNSTNRFDFLL